MRWQAVTALLVLLASLAGVAFGFYEASQQFFGALASLEPAIAAAMIGALGTILAGTLGVIWNQRSLQKRQIAEAHRPSKTSAYESFINDIIIRILRETKSGELKPEEYQELFYKFMGDIVVWSSPQFIKAYEEFRSAGQRGDERSLVYLDDVLQAIRKDLGHRDWRLQRGDLIKLFLTDPESVEKLLKE